MPYFVERSIQSITSETDDDNSEILHLTTKVVIQQNRCFYNFLLLLKQKLQIENTSYVLKG